MIKMNDCKHYLNIMGDNICTHEDKRCTTPCMYDVNPQDCKKYEKKQQCEKEKKEFKFEICEKEKKDVKYKNQLCGNCEHYWFECDFISVHDGEKTHGFNICDKCVKPLPFSGGDKCISYIPASEEHLNANLRAVNKVLLFVLELKE